MSNRRMMAITIVTGLLSGFGGAFLVAPLTRTSPTPQRSAVSERANERPQRPGAGELAAWLEDGHEQRLLALEAEARAGKQEPVPVEPGTQANSGSTGLPDLETAREESIRQWDEQLENHAAEPVDPKWAPNTAKAFEDDVLALAQDQHFQLVGTQCKSTTCSVTVQWNDYGNALTHYTSLLHHKYQTGCMREILLPEPENRERPYQATVLYNCAEARKGS